MSMERIKIYTSPKWIGQNIKSVIAVVLFLWGFLAATVTYITAVNATVAAMPKVKEDVIALGNKYSGLEGKVDTMIKLQTFQVLGQRKEAVEFAHELQQQKP